MCKHRAVVVIRNVEQKPRGLSETMLTNRSVKFNYVGRGHTWSYQFLILMEKQILGKKYFSLMKKAKLGENEFSKKL